MNKKITLSLALLSFIFSANAQDSVNDEIDNAIKYGRYDVAKKELYKLVRSQPTQGKHFYRLGLIHLNENNQDSRSEEHTSELQSRENLVCRLLLEKKKTE